MTDAIAVDDAVDLERQLPDGGLLTFVEGGGRRRAYHYTPPGGARTKLRSVTTVLGDVLPKPQLLRWYEARGASAAVALERAGLLADVAPDDAADALRQLGHGAAASGKTAQDRGRRVHAILEQWALDGSVPNPADYPEGDRPYIQGLMRFLVDARPEPTSVERLVCNPGQNYAGRMDLRAIVDGRDSIIDLKTNAAGRIYREAHLQARGYDIAEQVMGEPPADQHLLVAVGEDGAYHVVPGLATDDDWLAVTDLSRRLHALDVRLREQTKALAA